MKSGVSSEMRRRSVRRASSRIWVAPKGAEGGQCLGQCRELVKLLNQSPVLILKLEQVVILITVLVIILNLDLVLVLNQDPI